MCETKLTHFWPRSIPGAQPQCAALLLLRQDWQVVLIRLVCFMMVLLSRVIYTIILLILSLADFKAFSFWIMKLDVFVPRNVPLLYEDTDAGKVQQADSFIH